MVHREGGKYSKLLREIEVERDRASYGEFYDWGHWSGTSWAGYKDLPPGYWVYVAPNWYIFGKAEGADSGRNPPMLGKRKYGKLLVKIKVEQDVSSYGEYYDYGHYSGSSYYGYKDLPSGYWVYVAPYWYIFGEASSTCASPSPPPVQITPQSNRQRIQQLEIEVKQLRNEVRQLRQKIQ
jgi:hypothetical protein